MLDRYVYLSTKKKTRGKMEGFALTHFVSLIFFPFYCFEANFEIHITWLNESNVEYFIHLTVVRSNVEHAFRRILNAGDVDGNKIFGYLLPFNGASTTCRYMKHFGPQPEYTNEIKLVVMKQQKLCFTFKLCFLSRYCAHCVCFCSFAVVSFVCRTFYVCECVRVYGRVVLANNLTILIFFVLIYQCGGIGIYYLWWWVIAHSVAANMQTMTENGWSCCVYSVWVWVCVCVWRWVGLSQNA